MEQEILDVLKEIKRELQDIRSIMEPKKIDIQIGTKSLVGAIHDSVLTNREK